MVKLETLEKLINNIYQLNTRKYESLYTIRLTGFLRILYFLIRDIVNLIDFILTSLHS